MYILDTNIVLHATRQNSPVSAALDAQFQLSRLSFRPAVCEVSIGELWAFARPWSEQRRDLLRRIIDELLVIPIGREAIYLRWAELYSHARAHGLPIQNDHNDVWIAATAYVTGLRLLSADRKAFLPLRGTSWVEVTVVDPKTGIIIP
ncbi:MAG: type II toxin-antitoxin system VapC family toxin [Terrimicrobiaceae bacterium]